MPKRWKSYNILQHAQHKLIGANSPTIPNPPTRTIHRSLGNVVIHWVGERCIRGETVAQAAVECIEVRMPE